MPRSARLMLRLLAVLLLAQWSGGLPAHLRAMAAMGEAVVICSPDGTYTLHLGADGRPAKPAPATAICCLLCQTPAGGDLAPPPALPTPRNMAAPEVAMAAAVRAFSFRPLPRTQHSRAPPVS
ncbi:hypothetical protein CR165_16710 [Pseudoroseomonas aestuarii]|uniref:DUF2946 domain-containing protein n=2 Tax=Teichococcus aestuarii TaxID=568898 RepID=A0A2U1V1B8_9PROT|nr:hypothetical protein CR165_16710 [Pseudoroseomonas aestuarii]